jgi:hypothetical protein
MTEENPRTAILPIKDDEIAMTEEGLARVFEGDPKANLKKILVFLPSPVDDLGTEEKST